ncbi:hypothetical protein [Pseudonocardia asaccharolytica]|uniref:Uncharacterized protein n=1 Tax=Pseudonocardia asaccharolytica DSM 44247 = NBRC 16224 TaxID=1123024 RepID=A0A511D1B2_9PSEU|nr:hypothetical protein [Pseudonocardia asaccharolytica]GEL18582.1 hypothetical protein PA7_24190 [Pseudonocardia asaccharolytica DSM 44247 = NBRC 16224]
MTLRDRHCAQCGLPSEETHVLSTHHTSEGWVRYRRCVCGEVTVELVTPGRPPRDVLPARTRSRAAGLSA